MCRNAEVGREPRRRLPDSAAGSVCSDGESLLYIVLVRRSDAALGLVEVPTALVGVLRRLTVRAVVQNADALRSAVNEAMGALEFEHYGVIGEMGLRGGADPAALGEIRHFNGCFAVDVGEFALACGDSADRPIAVSPLAEEAEIEPTSEGIVVGEPVS